MRQGVVLFLGFLAFLGQSLPALLPPTGEGPAVISLGRSSGGVLSADQGDVGPRPVSGGDSLSSEDAFDEEERNVNVTVLEDEVSIDLESQSAEKEDEVQVHYGAAAARLKVSFVTLAPQGERVEMYIEFRDLIEFEDNDGDGAFSPLDDEVLRWTRVETLFLAKPLEKGQFSADSFTGHQVNVSYGLPGSPTGTFDLIFRAAGLPVEFDGVTLGATETKIDIRFKDFPYASNTSQLALGLAVLTDSALQMDPSLRFDQINASGTEFAAFFRWMPRSVMVDGERGVAEATIVHEIKTVESRGSAVEFENQVRLFLAYPRGAEIVHDPVVGIIGVSGVLPIPVPVPSLATYAIGLATALALVGGLWMLRRRRS